MEKDKKDFLQSIIDDSSIGVMVLEEVASESNVIQFSCILVNNQFAVWAGAERSKLIGKQLPYVFSKTSAQKLHQRILKVLEEGESLTFDQWVSFIHLEEGRWFKVSVILKDELVLLEFQEIGKLKEAEDAAEWNELKYKMLFEESLDAILVTNSSYSFVNANEAFSNLFDFDRSAIKSASLESLFANGVDYQNFLQLISTDPSEEHEINMIDQSGKKKTCIVNASQMSDEEEHFFYLFVIRDVTKRKQAENQFLRIEKLALTGKISRMIAHEVRNPLTNLNLALEQLRDELGDQVKDSELYFDIIQRNAERINTLISDLLNSSKPKQLNLRKQPIESVVDSSIEMIRDRLALKEMTISCHYNEQKHFVSIDEEQMRTAILNLIVNAVEAMKPGIGHLEVSLKQIESQVLLKIKDNGKGISEDHLRQLFEPFFTGKKTGTGLGLTAVQNIINAHKGQIDVVSQLNKGTTFIVSLPIS